MPPAQSHEQSHEQTSQDRQRIDVNDAEALRYWSKTLAVTEAQLKSAAAAVGPQAAKVREYLEKMVARP